MKKSWITTLVAGAAIGVIAVAAVATIDHSDKAGPRNAQAETTPDTSPDTGTGNGGSGISPVRTVTVAGEGIVTVKPDTARVDLGVSVTESTAKGALAEAADKANALIATLKATGIAEDDIRTSGLSLYPRYDDSYQNITGYNVTNSVTVTIRKIDSAGSVIDAAAGFVGDAITISGISFFVDDDAAATADARDAAMADAKLRAEQFSAAAGASVGQVLTISEVNTSTPQPLYYETAAADSAGESSTPIQTGTQDLTVTVTVTYQLG